MMTVIVELVAFGVAKEYMEVSLADAKEILARPMNPGWRWHIPEWQFNDDGGTPAVVMDDRARAAMRAVALA